MTTIIRKLVNHCQVGHTYKVESLLSQRCSVKRWSTTSSSQRPSSSQQSSELDFVDKKSFLIKEFPEYYHNARFTQRISHVDFVEVAMQRMDDIGANKSLEVYKDLMKIFPPNKYVPRNQFDLIGTFCPAQQNTALRLLQKMERNIVRPDKEMEDIVVERFSKNSMVWQKVCRSFYWNGKGYFVDLDKLPDELPNETYNIAKLGMTRMIKSVDPLSEISVINTSRFPDANDKTWIVSCQSPIQQSIIEGFKEDTILRVENGGLTFVGEHFLNYYTLKIYGQDFKVDSARPKKSPITFDANRLEFSFYGKPIMDKLYELNHLHHDKDCHILAIAMTGTSSQDSLVSWVKHLQGSNPKLSKLSVLFEVKESSLAVMDGKPKKIIRESNPPNYEQMVKRSL